MKKRTRLTKRLALVAWLVGMAPFGCSSDGGEQSADASGGGGSLRIDVDGIGAGGASTGAGPTEDANCGVETSETTSEPTDVLLVLDRSGSMYESISEECCCSDTCRRRIDIDLCADTGKCTERWSALTSAVSATMAETPTISWGLKMYSTPGSSGACGVSPGVEVGIGDGSAAVQNVIATVEPLNGTPTAKAVREATTYLEGLDDAHSKVMLLATDGEPNCRSGRFDASTPDVEGTLEAIAAASAAGYRVYVVGIGPSVGNLDSFAVAGGTSHYYPANSAAELAAALAAISNAVASCTFTMQEQPPDPDNVAVYLDGELVAKDPDNGWSFGTTTQTVMLNGTACDLVTSGSASRVQVLFGCPDEPPPTEIPR